MREKSIIKENISKYLDFVGVSKYQFYQKTGVSNGVLSQKSGMSEENIVRFLSSFPEVNPQWLLTGFGPMVIDSSHSQSRTDILEEPEILYGSGAGVPELSDNDFSQLLKSVNLKEDPVRKKYVMPLFDDMKTDFILTARSKAMASTIDQGDLIVCQMINKDDIIIWGNIYVLSTKSHGLMIRRLKKSNKPGHYLCVSDNSEFEPFDLPIDEIKTIARVVGGIWRDC